MKGTSHKKQKKKKSTNKVPEKEKRVNTKKKVRAIWGS